MRWQGLLTGVGAAFGIALLLAAVYLLKFREDLFAAGQEAGAVVGLIRATVVLFLVPALPCGIAVGCTMAVPWGAVRNHAGYVALSTLTALLVAGACFLFRAYEVPMVRCGQMAALWSVTYHGSPSGRKHLDPNVFKGHVRTSTFSELKGSIDSIDAKAAIRRQEVAVLVRANTTDEGIERLKADPDVVAIGLDLVQLRQEAPVQAYAVGWGTERVAQYLSAKAGEFRAYAIEQEHLRAERKDMLRYACIAFAAWMAGGFFGRYVHARKGTKMAAACTS